MYYGENKYLIVLLATIVPLFSFSQDFKPYNTDFKYRKIDSHEVIAQNDSLQALIIVFTEPSANESITSLNNNLQLKEIKLINPPQDFVLAISSLRLNNLTHLLIEQYGSQQLVLHALPTIEHLKVESQNISHLIMDGYSLNHLQILDINTPQLVDWKSDKNYPRLGLINLIAPNLTYFPIESMPVINQFSFQCSFDSLPNNLCSYRGLKLISFTNYKHIDIEKCLRKKIRNGVYSNLTIYDRYNGTIVSEFFSKDRGK